MMADISESVNVFLETSHDYVNNNGQPNAIDVIIFDENPVLPNNISHLNSNSLSSDEAENTPLPTDTSHLNSNLLSNNEAMNTPLPSDSSHLNIGEPGNAQIIPSLQDSLNDMDMDVFDSFLDKPASTSSKQIEDYKVGDIVWAKIGKYPYWPSIVCVDPKFNIHYKKKKRILIHVRFFNDRRRRSWTKTTENYSGKSELLLKYPSTLIYFKKSKKLTDMWDLAVEEADNLMKLDRESRLIEFFKSFCNSDSVTPSVLNKSSEGTIAAVKVRTYSRKRSLAVPEQDNDSKIMKTENITMNCTSTGSIDIPPLSRSDDADSTVSDFSMSYAVKEDLGLKVKQETIKKRRSTKTYPPKSSVDNKYDLSYSIMNSPENNDSNSVSDNQDKYPVTTTTSSTRSVPHHKKLEISTNSNKEINLINGDYSIRLQRSLIKKSRIRVIDPKKMMDKKKYIRWMKMISPDPDPTHLQNCKNNVQ